MVHKKPTRNALVGEFMVVFLHVFIASRATMNSVLFIRRRHALQLVRRSTLISPRTGFNSVCIRKENGTPYQQRVCVRWCHHLCLVLPVGVLIVLKLQFLVSNWSRTFGRSPERRVFPMGLSFYGVPWYWAIVLELRCGLGGYGYAYSWSSWLLSP